MNMKYILFVLTLFIYAGSNTSIFSQETQKPSLDKSDVENQFNYVLRNASDYEDSKVVKSWWLWRLKSHVLDSLSSLKDSINDAFVIIDTKNNTIDSLKAGLLAVNQKLTAAIKEKNSLKFLGLSLSKGVYNIILWTIIAILVLALLIFMILYKRSNSLTSMTKSNLEEVKDEFETFRKRALEREQQIARELYDEIIKYKKKLGEL